MAKATITTAPRLKALYREAYTKELQAELGLSNVNEVPKLEKIIISVGIGKNKDDKRHYEVVRNTVTKITGQSPIDHGKEIYCRFQDPCRYEPRWSFSYTSWKPYVRIPRSSCKH